LLISAFLFFNRADRTDFSVLDRFVLDPAATRKTGDEVANYLKTLLPTNNTAALVSDSQNIATSSEIIGTDGNDTLIGDTGDNILVGGTGDDTLTGDLGADSFKLAANSGNDRLTDFNVGEDTIVFDPSLGLTCTCQIFAALTTKGTIGDRFSSELNLGTNGTIEILHDELLSENNFVII
jgi:hypothetical protein